MHTIGAGKGTPAGANGVHGQHGNGHGVGAYAAFLGQLGRPVDQGHVGGGASHVKAQHRVHREGLGHGGNAGDAAGGAREQQLYRVAGREGGRQGPTMGGHDGQARGPQSLVKAL